MERNYTEQRRETASPCCVGARTLEAVLLILQAVVIVVIVSILERAGNR
ncbi:MAG TPA: hypothetical protein VLG48_08545 [Candidatus Methylomirabilis sp.]|nr:hypothetical protein [Candidatus Methylomirabilis sp.]